MARQQNPPPGSGPPPDGERPAAPSEGRGARRPAGEAPRGHDSQAAPSRFWTTLWTVLILLGLLGAAGAVTVWAWSEIGEVEISRHGLIALGLGAGLTLLVGVGLMTLVFFSSRRGFDERAHDWSQTEYQRRRSDADPDAP